VVILQDSREQRPFAFTGYDACVVVEGLPSADYSLPGFQDRVGIERKAVDDLIACMMGENRVRFSKELRRLSTYDLAVVVVEASMEDISQHRYRSDMRPHAVLQSVLAMQVRHKVPFLWCGNRVGAEYVTFWTLAKFMREVEERFKAATKGQERAA